MRSSPAPGNGRRSRIGTALPDVDSQELRGWPQTLTDGVQPALDEAAGAATGTARRLLKKRHIVVLARGPRGSLND